MGGHQKSLTNCAFSLACTIGSMSIACGSLISISNNNEKVSLQRGLFILSLGFVYFISLTDFCNKFLLETFVGKKFCKKFRLLVSDVMDITNKIVSVIQATLSCIAGYMVCNSSCRKSFLTASHFMSDSYAWFGCAYFIYDMWSMYTVHVQKIADKLIMLKDSNENDLHQQQQQQQQQQKGQYSKAENNTDGGGGGFYDKFGNDEQNKQNNDNNNDDNDDDNIGGNNYIGKLLIDVKEREHIMKKLKKIPTKTPGFLSYCLNNPVMTIHHVFLGSFGLFVIVYLRGNFGDCVYGFIYLMEFSTPFVSIRGILSTMRQKDSIAYVINGLIMLITFFICRIVMWPYLYYWYSVTVNMTIFQAINSLPKTCKIGTMILFLPQLYWFYLMLRGAIDVFFPKPKPSTTLQIPTDNHQQQQQQFNSKKTTKNIH